jgi:hypothetical protein
LRNTPSFLLIRYFPWPSIAAREPRSTGLRNRAAPASHGNPGTTATAKQLGASSFGSDEESHREETGVETTVGRSADRNQFDEAVELYHRAIQQDPPLHADPRWRTLMRKMGFAD